MISSRKYIILLLLTFLAIGTLLGASLIHFLYSNTTDGGILTVRVKVYVDGSKVLEKEVDSPVENFGKLMAAWLEMEYTGGALHTVVFSPTAVDGTTRTDYIRYMYDGTTTTASARYLFWLIDDGTPVPFTRNMYTPLDADSTKYELKDSLSGYYVDQNGNLVVFIQSEVFSPTQNITIEAISLLYTYNQGAITNANTVLLFYDLLGTPLSVQAGQSVQIEYDFIFP